MISRKELNMDAWSMWYIWKSCDSKTERYKGTSDGTNAKKKKTTPRYGMCKFTNKMKYKMLTERWMRIPFCKGQEKVGNLSRGEVPGAICWIDQKGEENTLRPRRRMREKERNRGMEMRNMNYREESQNQLWGFSAPIIRSFSKAGTSLKTSFTSFYHTYLAKSSGLGNSISSD